MTKLTQINRDAIIHETLADTIVVEIRALDKAEYALAEKIYDAYTTKEERDILSKLDAKWLQFSHVLSVNVGGWSGDLSFQREHPMRWTRWDRLVIADEKLAAEIKAHLQKNEEIKRKRDDAITKLKALLNSVTTIKRLAEVWPEGKAYWSKYDVKTALPAIPVQAVNEVLGLPKEAKK